jgi:hypothetical protein
MTKHREGSRRQKVHSLYDKDGTAAAFTLGLKLGLAAHPKVGVRIADLGATVLTGSPADFTKFVAMEFQKWAKVIQAANIKPE